MGKIKLLLILYTAVMLHEAAHFSACCVLGEDVRELRLMPYGINLRTESIANPLHSLIISLAGPLASVFLFLVSGIIATPFTNTFRACNGAIFMLNICPALPLDGGVALKSVLTYKRGYIYAHNRSMEITRVTAIVLGLFGIIFLLLSKYNISLLVISGFLLYNLRVERKNVFFLRQMIYSKKFDRSGSFLKIKHKAVVSDVKAVSLTDCFGYNFICHFFVYDRYMNLLGTLTQSEIVDGIANFGAGVTAGGLLGGTNEHKG